MTVVPAPGRIPIPTTVRRLAFGTWQGKAAVPLAIIAVWYLVAWLVTFTNTLFPQAKAPYPHAVVVELVTNTRPYLQASWISLSMALLGFVVGSIVAMLIGTLVAQSTWAESAFMPYLLMAQMIPVIALVPIIQTIFRNPTITRVLIAGFVTLLPVAVSTVRGLKSAAPEAHELMESLDASRWQTLVRLQAPAAIPLVFTGLRIAAPLAVLGSVLVDLTGATNGLGFLVLAAQVYGPSMAIMVWVSMLILALLGALMVWVVSLIERVIAPWDVANRAQVA
jgi:NitT/TauT family transport system permease protein